MQEKLTIKTQECLYDPIEIDIDGMPYKSVKLTRNVIKELNKYDEKVNQGDADALYTQVEILYPIDKSILEKLDKREVEDIIIFTRNKFRVVEKQRADKVVKDIGDSLGVKKPQKTTVKNRTRSGDAG